MIIPSKHCGYGEGGRLTSTRRVYDSGPSSPSSQTVTQTTIPEYARPYVEATLGQAWPMVNQPMQQYQGERFAQFSPLQQQTFDYAQGLGAAPQMQTASNIAAAAAQQGLGYGNYNPMQMQRESFAAPGAAQQFMSPYMQNVVDFQQRDARRQADIARQQQQAQAVAAGAFGGSRRNIQQAEANRALQTQLGGIQAQGLQNAYQQAQQQFNQEQQQRQQAMQLMEQSRQYGAGLGLQGLQAAMQGAGQLGTLGQGQFGQNVQALQLQNQLGQQQQQYVQNVLNQQYQDWLNYQNYPYKQLGFMSDILRGMPLSQSATTMYQGPGSTLGQIAGLGLGAYGAFGKAEGGVIDPEEGMVGNEGVAKLDDGTLQQEYIKAVRSNNEPRANAIKAELQYRAQRFSKYKGMAGGGYTDSGPTDENPFAFAQHSEPVVRMARGGPYPQSVTSPENVKGILDKLSDAQLKQARQIAVAERDEERVDEIDKELAQRASERSGLSAAFNMSPMGQQPMEESMARGGIVAFAGDGEEGQITDSGGGTSPAGRFLSSLIGGVRDTFSGMRAQGADYEEREKLRNQLISKYGAASAAPGLFMAQTDPQRELAQNIMSRLDTISTPEMRTLLRGASDGDYVRKMAQEGDVGGFPVAQKQKETKPETKPETKLSKGENKAVTKVAEATAATTGQPKKSLADQYREMLTLMKDTEGEKESKSLTDLINKLSTVDKPTEKEMLTRIGLRMAQAASKPGARFLGSLTEGLTEGTAMQDQYRKDLRDAQKLGAQLTIEKTKYDAANRRGDRQAALGAAQNMQNIQLQQDRLAEDMRHHQQTEKYQMASLGKEGDTLRMAREIMRTEGIPMSEAVSRIYGRGDKTVEQRAKVIDLLGKSEVYRNAAQVESMLAGKSKLTEKEQARLDAARSAMEGEFNRISAYIAPKPPAGGGAAVPPEAIAALKSNPSLRAQFDQKYGAGAAARYLGQ